MADGNAVRDTLPAPRCIDAEPDHEAAIRAAEGMWTLIRNQVGSNEFRELCTNAAIRHNALECQDGWCDGGEDYVQRCCRHELTGAAAETEALIRLLLESKLRRLDVDGPVGQRFVKDVLSHLLYEAEKGWLGW